ncbi:MAG: nitroreductase family protein [Pseudomonadota bacterium]
MIPKSIDTVVPVLPLFAERYSGVSYDPDRSVTAEQMLALAEAARWAPSCFGDQPWRYLICNKATNPVAWETAWNCLVEKNQAWCKAAPVLIVVCCDTVLSKTGQPNGFGPYDTGAASVSMCLQAAALGLMTHQMAGFVAGKARELFDIPERFIPLAMMAVGYQLPEDQLTESFKARELAPRVRNPLEQNFFAGVWGEGLIQD